MQFQMETAFRLKEFDEEDCDDDRVQRDSSMKV